MAGTALLFVGLLCGAGLARAAEEAADDPDEGLEKLLEAEVEGASKYAQRTLDAPAVVRLFQREDAVLLGHTTVGDMLQRLPGVYLTTTRSYGSLGLRGFNRPSDYNSRVLMTIDGYRVNDVIYDQALPGYEFPIPADWIKRTELIYGPSSSVYGGNALFGVANFVTVDGADVPGAATRVSAGSFGSARAMAQYGQHSAQGGDLFIGVVGYRSRGEDLHFPELSSNEAPDGVARGLDGTRYHALMAKYRLGNWRATLVASERDKDVATAEYGSVFGAPGTRYTDGYRYGELAWDGAWNGNLRLSGRANLSTYNYYGRYVYDDGGGPASYLINRDDVRGRWAGGELRLQWRGWTNHAVVAGLEGKRVLRADLRNYDENPPATVLDSHTRYSTAGVYVQDQVRVAERWSVTAGARVDRTPGGDAEFSPRIAMVWRASAAQAWKLSIGRAFRAPNVSERDYADDVSQVANPALQRERIQTAELAWDHALSATTRVSASVYRYQLEDMIDFVLPDATTIGQYRNVGRARTTGVDVEIEQANPGGWRARASASLLRASVNGEPASNSPKWMLKGHALAPVALGWWLGGEFDAIGKRSGKQAVDAYAVVNGVLRYAVARGHELSLRATNLGDVAAYDVAPAGTPADRLPRPRRAFTLDWQATF